MKNYDAKKYLQKEINYQECVDLFLKWIHGSDKYTCDGLAKSSLDINERVLEAGYKYKNDNISLTIKHGVDSLGCSVTACQFINNDSKGKWIVSVVFFKGKDEDPYVLIQQDCDLNDIATMININRPYLVTMILDNGWIDSACYKSFGGKEYCKINSNGHYFCIMDQDIDSVSEIMLGKGDNDLPVVYFSYNLPRSRYGVSKNKIEKIAKDLAGTAYVLLDPQSPVLIDKISLKTKTKKVFRGHIGIYFPGDPEVLRINPEYHKSDLIPLIKHLVWTQRSFHRTSQDITWQKILDVEEWDGLIRCGVEENLALQKQINEMSQKIDFLKYISAKAEIINLPMEGWMGEQLFLGEESRNYVIKAMRRGLEFYSDRGCRGRHLIEKLIKVNEATSFLASNVREVNEEMLIPYSGEESSFEQKLESLDAKRFSFEKRKHALQAEESQYAMDQLKMLFLPPDEKEFFDGEFNDLILLCIQKEIDYAENQHEIEILEKIMSCNHESNCGRRVMESIAKQIRESDPWTGPIQKGLERAGFVFESSAKHHKAYYKDQRYPVIFSCTASDVRAAKNTASDIMKKISIYAID